MTAVCKKSVRSLEVSGKLVLHRVDFNVPIDEATGKIQDDFRIRAPLDSIKYLRQQGAKVILCSHLGRPKGRVVERLRLAPVASHLEQLLGAPVTTLRDCIGPEVEGAIARLGDKDVVLLENLRFYRGEQENDYDFAGKLASLADVFVNDAFATSHRLHASIVGIPKFLPAVAGLLMKREIDYLSRVLLHLERPFGVVFGGAKISDKIGVIRAMLTKGDIFIVGGGMGNTFLKASGLHVGDSLVEDASLDTARAIMSEAECAGTKFMLPRDVVVADSEAENIRTVWVEDVPEHFRIMDVGPTSIDEFVSALSVCKTIVWNGPLGVFERPPFDEGSKKLAAEIGNMAALRLAGGGDTSVLHRMAGLEDCFDQVSTGGGAFLKFLEVGDLPGVAALADA